MPELPTSCPKDCDPESSEFWYCASAVPNLPRNMFSFADNVATLAASGAVNVGSTAAMVALIASSPGGSIGI